MKIKAKPGNNSTEIEMVVSKIPESFTVDHRNMPAPQVRKAGVLTGPAGDKVSKFDLRFVKPNHESMPTGAIHTLEHLLALYLRMRLKGIIDLSPMGCRTGFYLSIWGEPDSELIKKALLETLQKVISCEEDDIPAISAKECGNYRDHSLTAAKEYAHQVLEGFKKS